MPSPRLLYIIGSGPVIGSHVARLFATHPFTHIALFSRSSPNLARDASFINTAAPSARIHTYSADLTSHTSFTTALKNAVAEAGPPEVVVYNAARIEVSISGEYICRFG